MTRADFCPSASAVPKEEGQTQNVKKTRFPVSLFWTVLGMLLLTSGINVGLVVLFQAKAFPPIISVHVILLYWILASLLIVFYIRLRMKRVYEIPLQKISKATERVSRGDFSVRIKTLNPPQKYDYLDVMIMDLNRMIEDLGGMEMLKTDFISNVSHELKTPLSAMQNYALMLQSPDLSEPLQKEYAQAIFLNCQRLTNLVSNILKLNKLENQHIFPAVPPYDLGERLRECVLSFEDAWTKKNLELEADIADGVMVTMDAEILSLAWNNLLSNAIKFTPEGGKISIKMENLKEPPCIEVSVQDSGCGMSEKTKAHVFEKFFQGDTSHTGEGNGLGLALAHRAVFVCGGSIAVESQEGKGSRFTVRLSSK